MMDKYKNPFKLNIIYIVTICLLFSFLSACDADSDERIDNAEYIQLDEVAEIPVKTLTLHTENRAAITIMLNHGAFLMNRTWQERNEEAEFQLKLVTFESSERHEQEMRLQVALMSGQGYDMFVLERQPLWSYAVSGFLTNIYELIEQDTRSGLDDFYENILTAWEIDGGLYAFPLAFGFDFVGINTNLPQEFKERFARHDSISIHELLRIYIDLKQGYPAEFGNFSLSNGHPLINPEFALAFAMNNFIDFNTRTSLLNSPDFVEFLEDLNRVFDATDIANQITPVPAIIMGMYTEYPIDYVFSMQNAFWIDPVFTFFPQTGEAFFSDFIPLSDDKGYLLLNQTTGRNIDHWLVLCVTAFADGPLAWEFISHMINAATNSSGSIAISGSQSLSTPIRRAYFREHLGSALSNALTVFGRGEINTFSIDNIIFEVYLDRKFEYLGVNPVNPFEVGNELLDLASTHLETYHSMPATVAQFIPPGFYEDILLELLLGTITAQAMAEQLHNRISLWFMELG